MGSCKPTSCRFQITVRAAQRKHCGTLAAAELWAMAGHGACCSTTKFVAAVAVRHKACSAFLGKEGCSVSTAAHAEEGWEWYEGVDTTGTDETYEPETEPETDESEAEQPAVLPRRPTAQEFAANPDRYLLQLLSRAAKKFCNAKWDPCDELADGSHAPCLRLCSKYRAYIIRNKSTNTQPYGLNNLCMPLRVPPREALRRRIAKRRCHYCENTKEGYVRIYLGVDACGNPVKEYLHRLVLLAFGPVNEPGAYTVAAVLTFPMSAATPGAPTHTTCAGQPTLITSTPTHTVLLETRATWRPLPTTTHCHELSVGRMWSAVSVVGLMLLAVCASMVGCICGRGGAALLISVALWVAVLFGWVGRGGSMVGCCCVGTGAVYGWRAACHSGCAVWVGG